MAAPSEKSIFLDALDREPGPQRHAFLASACAGNAGLRADVEALLRAHERPDPLLDEVSARPPWPIAECPGMFIGPYKLMEQIGEGGFGLVFVAEQQQPVRRRVALKVIKPGMDTREVIARFEAERQALALMDHPNIAYVLDAGETATGRPYFVMELVRGVPITSFCDQNQLSPRERLELFLHVCQAVQHAHMKGIIHRDLKPSNVLVTQHDGTPVVKVIDFGVAKAVGPHLTDKTIYTRFTQMIGTPLYMSPEQAEMSGLDVDTRSDIYSLGVLLYELLTSTTPFDRQRMQAAAFDEIRRIIREEDPPPMTRRLTTLGQALSTASAQRRTEPRKLTTLLRGDLDWIVMKALEKDRSRRYETAAAFAGDVRRFLSEEAVEARPPSSWYRFRKFARRNKVVLTTASLVLAALVLGTAVSIWQAVQAGAARAEADGLRKKAEEFADRLKEANILLGTARDHADEGRWAPAYADYTRAAKLQPDHYPVWSGRGSLYVRLGLWDWAAVDYAVALDLGANASGPGWWGIAQLMAYTGNEASYRTICKQLLLQADKTSDRMVGGVIVRSCLVSPHGVADAGELVRRCDRLLEGPTDWPGGPWFPGNRPPMRPENMPREGPQRFDGMGMGPGRPPMFQPFAHMHHYLAGLARYRAGRYPEAIGQLQQSLKVDPRWRSRSMSYPVLAMAYHRTGRQDKAREALALAGKAIDGWVGEMNQGPTGTMPLPWFDWLELLCLYREANVLITGAAPADDPRLLAVQERALAAIKP